MSGEPQFQGPCKARPDPDDAAVCGQNSVDLTSLGDRGYRAIDQPYTEIIESGIELERSHEIRGERQFVLIPGS